MVSRAYLAKRVLLGVLSFLAAATIIFLLLRAMPGDYITTVLLTYSNTLPPEAVADFSRAHGFDQPLHVQYGIFLVHAVTFDFGPSFIYGVPAGHLILDRLGWTLLLLIPASVFALLLGVAVGMWSAWRQGSRGDTALLGLMLAIRAIPTYWWGIMAILVFACMIPLFPIGGYTGIAVLEHGLMAVDVLWHAALPILVLTLVGLTGMYYLMRNSMIHTLQQDYVLFDRARGLPDGMVIRHAARNALLPVATMFALQCAGLIMGSVFIETVFSWPGVGLLTNEALHYRDIPVLEAIFLLDTGTLILANLIADLAYPYLDPRVKQDEQ